MSVCFGGSRSLSSVFSPMVRSLVIALGASGVSVGCAVGADEFVLRAALIAALPLSVFAVGASDGSGFWGGSAPVGLLRSAVEFGASVCWLAGGPLSIPLRARLLRRSVAALAGCSSLVLFLASQTSPGSLAVAGEAVRRGLWVWAVPCGIIGGVPAAPRGCAGRWVLCELVGVPVWRWVPAGEQLPLL